MDVNWLLEGFYLFKFFLKFLFDFFDEKSIYYIDQARNLKEEKPSMALFFFRIVKKLGRLP